MSSKQEELYNLCKGFIEQNNITCPEAICQCERIIINAYDFIEDICNVVGYKKYEEDGEIMG